MTIRSHPFLLRSLTALFAVSVAFAQVPNDPLKDQRLGWWREARFGMFIHWGVYSALAGEWKGQKVEGYSEHIQRICKIPRETYRDEVVKPFNPESFDADQWVRTAKEAGMGYIIITAMHHDGVAMFDSQVDDLNVVKMSRFGRDPLRELKAACDRQGIKLGFYYSHAVDWSLSGDPRFPEPNGPERRRACVERKALPQILELIRNYHPALLWGDTPHLNPKDLNEEILQAIRIEDPSVIINGRLASASDGDYVTTPDRPSEFKAMNGPLERDWEAIPTTNESYGYHRFDSSHKPPSQFIHLLAKAAARGGNLLLNIGPRGDGTMAPEDLRILRVIQQWWPVNGTSIRGTTRTPLAPQSWGESTLKGNRLYLHVFDWPADGRLLVGGLQGEIQRASLLADPDHPLTFQRQGPDLEIRLPAAAPDSADSVILLECKTLPQGDGTLLLQTNQPNVLSVFKAELQGPTPALKGWDLDKGTNITEHVKGWTHQQCAVRWATRLAQKGDFNVTLHYDTLGTNGKTQIETMGGKLSTASQDRCGGTFTVAVGSQTLKGEILEQGMAIALKLGRLSLAPGPLEIRVSADAITGKELMRLKSVTLEPCAAP